MPGEERETNRAVARQMIEAWNEQGETHLPEDLVSPQAVRHMPMPIGPSARGNRPSPLDIALPREAFPDQRYEVEFLIADETYAFIAWRMEGTYRGTLYGRSGSGQNVVLHGADLIRVADGKIIEHWDWYSKARLHALARTGNLDRDMQERLIQERLLGRNRRTGRRRLS